MLFEDDTRRHHKSPHVTAGDLQQLSDVGHAIIRAPFDTEVVREDQQTPGIDGLVMLHCVSDSIADHQQQQPTDVTATASQGIDVAANGQQTVDGHVVSRLLVSTDDTDVVNGSQLHSPETTQWQSNCQRSQQKVSNTDSSGKLTVEHHLPTCRSGRVQVQNTEKNGLPTSTGSSGHFSSSDSYVLMTEAGSIDEVSVTSFGVVQDDANLPASEDSKGLPFPAVVSDVKPFQPSDLPGGVDDGTDGVVIESTREVDDDLTLLQHITAVTREEGIHSTDLLFTADQHQHHESVGTSTNHTDLGSKTCDVDETNR